MHGADEIPRVPPITLGFQVSQEQFGRQAKLNAGHAVGDFPRDTLGASPGALVVEQNTVRAGDLVGFPVVQGEIETGDLTDAIRTARMKRRGLALRRLPDFTEHLARSGEIKAAFRLQLPDGLQDIVCPVDVGAHGGEAVGEAFRYEALRRQVITFLELLLGENVKYAGVALQAGGVNVDAAQASFQAAETQLGLLERYAPHHPM